MWSPGRWQPDSPDSKSWLFHTVWKFLGRKLQLWQVFGNSDLHLEPALVAWMGWRISFPKKHTASILLCLEQVLVKPGKVILITIWQEIHTLTDVLDFQNAAGWKLEYVYLFTFRVGMFQVSMKILENMPLRMHPRLWFAVWSRFPSQPAVFCTSALICCLNSWLFLTFPRKPSPLSRFQQTVNTVRNLAFYCKDCRKARIRWCCVASEIETSEAFEACWLPWGPAMLAWSKCTHLLSRSLWQAEALKQMDHRLTSRNLHESMAQWHHDWCRSGCQLYIPDSFNTQALDAWTRQASPGSCYGIGRVPSFVKKDANASVRPLSWHCFFTDVLWGIWQFEDMDICSPFSPWKTSCWDLSLRLFVLNS